MNLLCGIAVNRFGVTPEEFYWGFTPLEFHHALKDREGTHLNPVRNICETIRMVAVIVHNSTPFRKKKDMVDDPRRLWKFSWEQKPQIQTVEQMKNIVMGLKLTYSDKTKLTQDGKEVKLDGIG